MKVVILAGGQGRRLLEETRDKPKPMVTVGGRPLLWHIIKHYLHHGFDDFVIAAGYRGEIIRDYFESTPLDCRVQILDTGPDTATGGRLKRLLPVLGEGTFMMTWGDAVSDVDLDALLAFHRRHGRKATVTAVHPPPRFGRLFLEDETVTRFAEKRPDRFEWINGAYFVLEAAAVALVAGDATPWEEAPMEALIEDRELMAFRHEGFWQCVDTLHEREVLESLWRRGAPPWRVWR
ncbi:MAG: sugar phosphate nucleotidyltransferase [Arenicellales bacterium]